MDEDSPGRTVDSKTLIVNTAMIAAAYLSRNEMAPDQIKQLIEATYQSLAALEGLPGQKASAAPMTPAVSIRRSITPDYIVCLEDGKKLKMLKRHLRAAYNMSPEDYRKRWNLPKDYPMVAPNYARRRSDFAKAIGLGRARPAAAPPPPPAKRGRRRASPPA